MKKYNLYQLKYLLTMLEYIVVLFVYPIDIPYAVLYTYSGYLYIFVLSCIKKENNISKTQCYSHKYIFFYNLLPIQVF